MYNLTHAQKRIWYNEKIHGTTSMHNLIGLVNINKKINVKTLKAAINIFIKKNDGIRIRIKEDSVNPMQYFHTYEKVDIDFYDFSTSDSPIIDFENWLTEIKKSEFNLLDSDLFYFSIFKLNKDQFGYVGKFHHIIADGWSLNIAGEKISEYYSLIVNKKLLEDEEKYSYSEVILQEEKYLNSNRFHKNKKFWKDKFQTLPNNIEPHTNVENSAHRNSFLIDTENSIKIKEFIVEHKLSINSLFISAYLMYLHYTTEEKDLVVGTPVLNRSGKKEKKTFGMFTSTMPFRILVDETLEVLEFIKETIKELKKFYFHQKYPYDLLSSDLELFKNGYSGLFDVCINYYNTKFNNLFDGCTYETQEVFNGRQPYSLQIVISEWNKEGKIKVDFDYNLFKYNHSQIEKMYEYLINIIQFILKSPTNKISEIEMLSSNEKNELIYNLNYTQTSYPSDKSITQLFEEQVQATPYNVACYIGDEKITYSELNISANKLARFLKKKGIQKENVVGIYAHHSFELIIAILAVLKSGAAYLPIDPSSPIDRINFMLEDSDAVLLLKNCIIPDEISFKKEIYDITNKSLFLEDDTNLLIHSKPENLAYIIYTSGSTGQPKGVMVLQKGLVNYSWWAYKKYVSSNNEVFALYSSIAFDLTITSIFTPLISGNSINIYKNDGEFRLFDIMRDKKTTVVKLTPAHLTLIRETNIDKTSVRKLIVGGEDLKTRLAKDIYEKFNNAIEIYNEYGPTETVVGCMIHQYDYSSDIDDSIPIGIPSDNVYIYILNKYLKPVPVNMKGEIYISGDGVSKGYIHNSSLTTERFLNNPYLPGEKMYKTGDIGMWTEKKTINYLGREDNQLKLNGHRIELGEIEGTLLRYPDVKASYVNIIENMNGDKLLYAYYLSNIDIVEDDLLNFLRSQLPEYMIPKNVIKIESLPLTTNGKVDIKKLPVPSTLLSIKNFSDDATNFIEKLMVEIWAEVFSLEEVGIHDDFFALGGDSIKAIRVVSKLSNHDIELSVKDIMTHRSIFRISKFTRKKIESNDQGIASGDVKPTPIILWFLKNNFVNNNHYNQSISLQLKKELSIPTLELAFTTVIEHHDSLRLNLADNQKLFYNRQSLDKSFKVEYYDVSMIELGLREKEIKKIIHNLQANFDINYSLLIRAAIIDFGKGNQELFITGHHIIVDGISWRIILEDLFYAYQQLEENKDYILPKKTASFQKFADEIQLHSKSNQLLKELDFWNDMEFRKIHPAKEYKLADHTYGLSRCIEGNLNMIKTSQLLKGANVAYNTEAIELILTALALCVQDWANLTDFTYEIENHGRHIEHVDVSRTIGWFTVMHPLRIQIIENEIGKVISHVKEQIRKVPNKGIGYGVLKYILEKIKSDETSKIRLNYMGQFDKESQNDYYIFRENKLVGNVDLSNQLTTDIEINCMVINEQLDISIRYSQHLYTDVEMNKFLSLFLINLNKIIDYTLSKDCVHFTPSDFEGAKISQEDIETLFD
ncbi:non-ribosomal peptide synthetase [Metabacillus idriensis]|uniref:non-ribosomal peptide synthetase n=1 Tax=Metabacillus idriensis TaxID=324768 RepID=UPI001749E1E6|nr:non-ribosomal peptide synthetase [Metabacillus idriensis]MCM3598086.1 non-ribosomal peptide synthetase [Metabacillus idriensis]